MLQGDTVFIFTGMVLEGFFYGKTFLFSRGLYSAIFSIYIQHQTLKEGVEKTRNILLYPLCVLYILSTAKFVLDTIGMVLALTPSGPTSPSIGLHISLTLITILGLCDFISQAILSSKIYRCWIIWGCNIRVIAIPSILALAFLATWLAVNGLTYIGPDERVDVTNSGYALNLTSLAISLVVNGVVTGLIVLRILKVYWEIRPTFEDQTLSIGTTSGKIRSIIFIIIESGMAMFTIQSIGFVVYILQLHAQIIITCITGMFYGIAPTIILV
ncbi:hypothetical protein BYT27DRAFT_7336001 [Phlegmacium glaucopus]|nr:hypothetical protein BYT27DRAFT_7336001 [Phlegmacium glaucopus]